MTGVCKRRFDKSKFWLDHDQPYLMTASQWQSQLRVVSMWYVICRILICLFTWASLVANLATSTKTELAHFFIYLTRWGIVLLAVFQLLDVVLLVKTGLRQRRSPTFK